MNGVEKIHKTIVSIKDERIYTISGTDEGNAGAAGVSNVAFDNSLDYDEGQSFMNLKKNRAMTLAWNNIDVHTIPRGGTCCNRKNNTSKHILKNINGIVKPGSLVAIMGASGAGKTTLMNVLTNRTGSTVTVSGLVTLNGRVVGEEISSISAYIQQDDVFIPTLTVKEQLMFRALLRMDKSYTKEMRLERIEEVLTELNLKKCQNTLIGDVRIRGISGGERKRLSFASEILTDPPLIFLDEPTSGLDSFLARNLVATLKNLTSRGRTIIATIHQPSSEVFSMFDNLILLAEGEVAFMGPTNEALNHFQLLRMNYYPLLIISQGIICLVDYFTKKCGLTCPTNYNPADFYLDKLSVVPGQEKDCTDRIQLICDTYSRSENCRLINSSIKDINDTDTSYNSPYKENVGTLGKRYKATVFKQFLIVLWRSWLTIIRDPASLKIRGIQTIMIAIIFGLIYLRQEINQEGVMNINGFLFIVVTNLSFSSQFVVINIFPMELPVFQREYDSKLYSVEIYFLCKTLADIPFHIFFPFIFMCIDYWMVGLYDDVGIFFTSCGIVILVSNIAASFGYMVSCLARSTTAALALAPPLMIPLLIFGGFFVNSKSIPVYFIWLKYLSWFKYATEMLTIDQWTDVKNITCNAPPCIYTNGEQVLKGLGFDKENFMFDLWLLLVLLVSFRIFAYIFLVIRTKRCSRNCC